MIPEFKIHLKNRLRESLPGSNSHQKLMAGRKPITDINFDQLQPRESAVLLLLYQRLEEWHTVFIERPKYEGVHSGQIALPGGKKEEHDSSLQHTALREAEEELAIEPQKVEILGQLSSLYVPPSNFLITPFVGAFNGVPEFVPDELEVESVIEMKISSLIGEDKLVQRKINLSRGLSRLVKGYPLQENIIWGATGMMIKEFSEVIESIIPPNGLK